MIIGVAISIGIGVAIAMCTGVGIGVAICMRDRLGQENKRLGLNRLGLNRQGLNLGFDRRGLNRRVADAGKAIGAGSQWREIKQLEINPIGKSNRRGLNRREIKRRGIN
jgi:hypothetical protein